MDVFYHGVDRRVFAVEYVAGFRVDPVFLGMERAGGRWRRTGGMAEYYIEIPVAAGVDGVGGGRGTFYQRVADADYFSESFGGTLRAGYQFGGEFGSGFRGAVVREFGRGCLEPVGIYRGGRLVGGGYRGRLVGHGIDRVRFPEDTGKCHASDYRGDDRVYRECRYRGVEVF